MRRATIRTDHADPDRARAIARAISPDNTAEMETEVSGSVVETTIDRDNTAGLHSTADDYVVNLHVAAQLSTTDGETSTTNQS